MFKQAESTDSLRLTVGDQVDLESLRQSVVPPYVTIKPFVEVPEALQVVGQDGLGEDGVHGSVFHLLADKPGTGELIVGFRDVRTQEVTHRKSISVAVNSV